MMSRNGMHACFALAVMLCGAATVRADYAPFQGYVEMPHILAPMVMGNLATENLKQVNKSIAARRGGALAGGPLAAATSPASVRSSVRALATRYPAAQRPQIERAFSEAFATYRQLEAKLGIPGGDVAGAAAAYLAGSYMAYRDADVPDPHFKAMVEQLRDALASDSTFAHASAAHKRALYEQMAIVGTFFAATRMALKQQPADATVAANFRQAARSNLEQFLHTDADRISIGEYGLSIR